jgi:ABC-type antimicrobial peptide transport system permease subunit
VIGGGGVMNIMLVLVKERSAEIGIRRALGARRCDVRNQFLLEAVRLTGAGGLIGILLGFAFALLVRLAVSFPANVPRSHISRAARRKAPSAARESALPTLTRLTPSSASSARLSY